MTNVKSTGSDVAMTLTHSGNVSAGKNVPAFLLKLYNMVSDHSTDDLIRWNTTGDSFLVMRHEDFAKDLLPRYYKHNNFSSFVRQLNSMRSRRTNMTTDLIVYGFHKIPHIEDNTFSKTESSVWEFSNSNFHRDQPDLLCLVTRKKSGDTGDKDSLDYQTIMNEIHAIKRHQMTISQDLKRIQADNQALWQEQIDTRQRHTRHQETIDKILSFLGTLYGSQRNDDKSLRSKKRKLLLEHDANDSDENNGGARIFDDEETKATFDSMFKSASTSPVLRPLPKPTTDALSSNTPNGSMVHENRFTLPNHNKSHNSAASQSSSQQIRNMNKMKNLPHNSTLADAHGITPVNGTPLQDELLPTDFNAIGLLNKSYNTDDMQLMPLYENQISHNNLRTNELEQDLSAQEQNIEALASLLGIDPATLNASGLDEDMMRDMGYGGFDDFLNTSTSLAGTPQSVNGFPDYVAAPNINAAVNEFASTANGTLSSAPIRDSAEATISPVPPDSLAGSKAGSAGSTPASAALGDEHIEEIDMDRARMKKRKPQAD